jgi:hypothetical protein
MSMQIFVKKTQKYVISGKSVWWDSLCPVHEEAYTRIRNWFPKANKNSETLVTASSFTEDYISCGKLRRAKPANKSEEK